MSQAQGGAPPPQVADVEPKTTLFGATALGGAGAPIQRLLIAGEAKRRAPTLESGRAPQRRKIHARIEITRLINSMVVMGKKN